MNTVVSYKEVNDKKVFTILEDPETSEKKIVIMSHGFRSSSIGPARTFVDFSSILNKHGYSVLRFDQPNSANSEGEYLDSSFHEWVMTTTYFAKEYIDKGYTVGLLGQSMGATTSIIATSTEALQDKIAFLLLWVPGIPDKEQYSIEPETIYEEDGQKYRGRFWDEERSYDLFTCLDAYNGPIHLVYGEHDKYIRQELRDKLINLVRSKGQQTMLLPGQEHSPWEFAVTQQVYAEQITFLKNLPNKRSRV